jgi:hypothetical protein
VQSSEGFWKTICSSQAATETCLSSHAALEKQLNTTTRGLQKSVKILNLFARSDVNIYKKNFNTDDLPKNLKLSES